MLTAPKSKSNILAAIQERYPNYHPLIAIAEIAHTQGVDVDLAFQCHKTIAKYVEPELKAVEIKSESTGRTLLKVSLFGEDDVSDAEIVESPQLQNW